MLTDLYVVSAPLDFPCLGDAVSIPFWFWLNWLNYSFYVSERASTTWHLGSGIPCSELASSLLFNQLPLLIECSLLLPATTFGDIGRISFTSLSTPVLSNHPCQFLGHIIFLLYLFLLHQSLWNLLISLYLTNPISTIASLVPRPTTMTNLSGRPLLLLYCNLKCLQNCLRNM